MSAPEALGCVKKGIEKKEHSNFVLLRFKMVFCRSDLSVLVPVSALVDLRHLGQAEHAVSVQHVQTNINSLSPVSSDHRSCGSQ